jgi:type II secretory pathway component PulC
MTGSRRSRPGRTPLLLAVGCAALIGVVYVELDAPDIEPPAKAAVTAAQEPEKPPVQNPSFSMPPLRSFAGVLSRPLFSETRRPPLQPVVAADTRATNFTLVGTILSAKDRHALVEHGQPPHIDRVGEGQDVDGWTVEQILPDRVVFARADGRIELKPKDSSVRSLPSRRAAGGMPVTPSPVPDPVNFGVQLGAAPGG